MGGLIKEPDVMRKIFIPNYDLINQIMIFILEKGQIDIYNSPIEALYLDEMMEYVEFFNYFKPPLFDRKGNILVKNGRTKSFVDEGGVFGLLMDQELQEKGGITLRNAKDYDILKKKFKLYYGSFGMNNDIHDQITGVRLNNERYFLKKEDLQRAIERTENHYLGYGDSNEATRYWIRGDKAEKKGDLKEAIENYEKSIIFNIPIVRSYDKLIKYYQDNNDLYSEKRVLESAIKAIEKKNLEDYEYAITREEAQPYLDLIQEGLETNSMVKVLQDGKIIPLYYPILVMDYIIRLGEIEKSINNKK